MSFLNLARATLFVAGIVAGLLFSDCSGNAPKKPADSAIQGNANLPNGYRVILDFEEPNPPVIWETAAAATSPSTTASANTQPGNAVAEIVRSSVRPNTGLWALKTSLSGDQRAALVHRLAKPVNLQNYDTVTAAIMHTAAASRSGEWRAAVYLVDADGKKITGDAYPVTSRWRIAPLDLKNAVAEGLDVSRITDVGLEFVRGRAPADGADSPLEIQTDTWSAQTDSHTYIGQKYGAAKSFYVQRDGTCLQVGMVGQYELDFYQRAGTERPWWTVRRNGTLILGQPHTGLMLLNQDQYDAMSPGVRQMAYADGPDAPIKLPRVGWPVGDGDHGASTEWTWECAWTTPVAAIVEVKQTVGPFDQLGQPAAELKWRFMIYQWGQVFVHVEWTKGTAPNVPSGSPITWALVLDRTAGDALAEENIRAKSPANAERLLDAIYPAAIHESLTTALPDRMQKGAPLAMIAKSGGAQKNWWWTAAEGKRVFGVGVAQGNGPLDCMLLVNAPTALMQAGSFSQYLVPPKIHVRQGELDRSFPGDLDNDGLVESYGFQVIRLANARSSFTIYPQERPLFYPPYLFTVPAVERDADDLKNSRMLINIDGQQFTDPPQFPDGSFLLQMPYVIDRPVQVEGILIKK